MLGMILLKVGRSLIWDGAKEEIVGDAEASQLLRRPYCAGWEFPGS